MPKRPLDQLHLTDLIGLAASNGIIDAGTEQQAGLAKDARNLVHPGRALRSGDAILAAVILTATASAQQAPSPPPITPYGAPLGLEAAKKVMATAEAEAVKNNWAMAIVILDSTGHMVMLHKLDNTQYGSLMAAEDKALSAINYRRPSKVFEDMVAQGGIGLRSLALRGASPLEGGIPINVDGKIVGAIGVSGGTSVQDGQVAKAGADTAN